MGKVEARTTKLLLNIELLGMKIKIVIKRLVWQTRITGFKS